MRCIYELKKEGFLDEFIWNTFNRPYWLEPDDLKLNEFKQWADKNESKKFIVRPIGVDVLIDKYK